MTVFGGERQTRRPGRRKQDAGGGAAKKPAMRQCWTCKAAAWMKLMPMRPEPSSSKSRPFSTTTSVAAALTEMPLVPATSTPAAPILQEIVIDLVMVTAPKPPGSRQLIWPLGAVFEMAPAKVLHGALRLHGLASSPTPETQLRVARASADVATKSKAGKQKQTEQGKQPSRDSHFDLPWDD
jgi:hypothetical protein